MVETGTVVLSVVRGAVFLLGASVTWASYRAYRRTGEPFLRNATLGFAVVTVGVLVEGALYNLTSIGLTGVHVVESVAVGLGLLFLYLSLHH